MEQYDTVVLGYPNWCNTMPKPVCTFLEAYDFSGKNRPYLTARTRQRAGQQRGRPETDLSVICRIGGYCHTRCGGGRCRCRSGTHCRTRPSMKDASIYQQFGVVCLTRKPYFCRLLYLSIQEQIRVVHGGKNKRNMASRMLAPGRPVCAADGEGDRGKYLYAPMRTVRTRLKRCHTPALHCWRERAPLS